MLTPVQAYGPFVVVTLIIGILTCIFSYLQSKKTWHVNVASVRRKERIEWFTIYYSKLVALAHPDAAKGYALKDDCTFIEKIIENFSMLNMLFDHRFHKDTQLAFVFKKLTQAAIDYFNASKLPNCSDEVTLIYKDNYQSAMIEIDKLHNLFIGAEWSRLKKEVQKGKPIPAKEWYEQYEKDKKYYEQWDNKYRE
jgi:hypothetical protein